MSSTGAWLMNPVAVTAASTCFIVFGLSKATGAGGAPFSRRIQEACRASTVWIARAAPSTAFGVDQWGLAGVGHHARVLEHLCRLAERRCVLGRALEVEPRLLDRSRAEGLLECGDVGPLVCTDDPRERPRGRPRVLPSARLGVERRLEVLERQRVVQDRDVTRCCCPGGCGECAECGAASDDPADASVVFRRKPARVSANLLQVVHRLGDRAVAVDLGERE